MNIQLELAIAQAGWNYGENEGKWYVKSPEGKILFILEGNFDEVTAMQAIRLGRKYELKAFNIGIEYGKEIQKKKTKNDIAKLENDVLRLAIENKKLSEELEKQINKL